MSGASRCVRNAHTYNHSLFWLTFTPQTTVPFDIKHECMGTNPSTTRASISPSCTTSSAIFNPPFTFVYMDDLTSTLRKSPSGKRRCYDRKRPVAVPRLYMKEPETKAPGPESQLSADFTHHRCGHLGGALISTIGMQEGCHPLPAPRSHPGV